MVENIELRELYVLLLDVLFGFNRTHDVQVSYLDFGVYVEDEEDATAPDYFGSLVFARHEDNIINYHYRDLKDDDFDWFGREDWQYLRRETLTEEAKRKEAQRAHREGRLKYAPWLSEPEPYPSWDCYRRA